MYCQKFIFYAFIEIVLEKAKDKIKKRNLRKKQKEEDRNNRFKQEKEQRNLRYRSLGILFTIKLATKHLFDLFFIWLSNSLNCLFASLRFLMISAKLGAIFEDILWFYKLNLNLIQL